MSMYLQQSNLERNFLGLNFMKLVLYLLMGGIDLEFPLSPLTMSKSSCGWEIKGYYNIYCLVNKLYILLLLSFILCNSYD